MATERAATRDRTGTDLFVSYAWANHDKIEPLVDLLEAEAASVWIDRDGIPPLSDLWREIEQAIDRSQAVVCFLSPDYAASENCLQELDYAHKSGKRVVPVTVTDLTKTDEEKLPEWVRRIRWLTATDPHTTAAEILRIASSDLEWAREQSRLLVRAREWDGHGRKRSRLLRGTDVRVAEANLAVERSDDEPHAVAVQREFVAASRQHRTQLITAGGVVAAVVAVSSIALAAVSVQQRNSARDARAESELSLNRSEFERLSAATASASSLREAASYALSAYDAGIKSGLPSIEAGQAILEVHIDGDRPLVRYNGRADSYQLFPVPTESRTGDQQGFAVSGDGSTMAYLDLTGGLEVVDLYTLTVRASLSGMRTFGATAEQVALDVEGTRLLYAASVPEPDSQSADLVPTRVSFTLYDISGDAARELESGVVPDYGTLLGAGFGPDESIVFVDSYAGVQVVDLGSDPWAYANSWDMPTRSQEQDVRSINFSADGERLCVGATAGGLEVGAFYRLQPLQLISTASSDGCVPEPCGGSDDNRIEIYGGTQSDVVGDSTVETYEEIKALCTPPGEGPGVAGPVMFCGGQCAIARGVVPMTGDEFVPGLDLGEPDGAIRPGGWEIAASEKLDSPLYVVPGPNGNRAVSINPSGLIQVADPRTDLVERTSEVSAKPSAYVIPAYQGDGAVRYVTSAGEVVDVETDGTLLTGAFADVPTISTVAAHRVGDQLAIVQVSEGSNWLELRDVSGEAVEVGPEFSHWAFGASAVALVPEDTGQIELWDLTEQEHTTTVGEASDGWCGLAMSPGGTALVAVDCRDDEADQLFVWGVEGSLPRLVDQAELRFDFMGASDTLAVSDDASVAVVAHGRGQIEVRSEAQWAQPAELMREARSTVETVPGWAAVSSTGRWIIAMNNDRPLELWLVTPGGLTLVGGVDISPYWSVGSPTVLHFNNDTLRLAWGPADFLDEGMAIHQYDLALPNAVDDVCALRDPTSPRPAICEA